MEPVVRHASVAASHRGKGVSAGVLRECHSPGFFSFPRPGSLTAGAVIRQGCRM